MTISKPKILGYCAKKDRGPWERSNEYYLSPNPDENYTVPVIGLSDYEALQAECDALRDKTGLSLGVGDGTGNLFVHGDYDSIKRVQELIFECEKLRKDAEFGRSVLAKRKQGKVYGCYCDLKKGMDPDGCVIDSGERHHCVYAKKISIKEQCEYWRVIVSDATTP